MKMDKSLKESLKIVNKLLDEMSNEEFISLYNECEKGIGPTVKEYLEVIKDEESDT